MCLEFGQGEGSPTERLGAGPWRPVHAQPAGKGNHKGVRRLPGGRVGRQAGSWEEMHGGWREGRGCRCGSCCLCCPPLPTLGGAGL